MNSHETDFAYMIISASRRTDIPAFYADWFLNRIRAGFCTVPNPLNARQVAQVSLKAEDVDVIVFWTRNSRPLLRHLAELDSQGYRYYFQYTLLGNPRPMDGKTPELDASVATFRKLADRIGPDRIIWRYDPIVWSNVTDAEFHQKTYGRIAKALRGYTHRSVISFMDVYGKAEKRLKLLANSGIELAAPGQNDLGILMPVLFDIAAANGMEILSCAEQIDLRSYGIRPGKCVDDVHIRRIFGLNVTNQKDPSQRRTCGCVVSRDIGMYDSCPFGCTYCYAVSNFVKSRANRARHDPSSPTLMPASGIGPKEASENKVNTRI